jgi:hypothetical protein
MANRSDFQSSFPRQFKRLVAMGQARGWIADAHERGQIKNILMSAHKHHRDISNKRGTMPTQADDTGE